MISAAVFGAATAAFLPRLAERLAVRNGEGVRQSCAVCSRPFSPGMHGWVRVGAACACTGGCLRVVSTGAAVATALAVAVGPLPLLPVYLLAAVPALLLAMIDVRCLRLPDPLVAALVVIAGVPLGVLRPEQIGTALAAGVGALVAYGIIALLPWRGLGLGDVKLAAALALILGFTGTDAVLAGVLTAHLIIGPVAMFRLITGPRRAIPFGPALLAGALIAITTA